MRRSTAEWLFFLALWPIAKAFETYAYFTRLKYIPAKTDGMIDPQSLLTVLKIGDKR